MGVRYRAKRLVILATLTPRVNLFFSQFRHSREGGNPECTRDMVNNKFRIWLVRFGRTASLQIAYVAEPHRTICA